MEETVKSIKCSLKKKLKKAPILKNNVAALKKDIIEVKERRIRIEENCVTREYLEENNKKIVKQVVDELLTALSAKGTWTPH